MRQVFEEFFILNGIASRPLYHRFVTVMLSRDLPPFIIIQDTHMYFIC